MPIAVISIESGIASAVMTAARKLPSSRKRTTIDRMAPSARLVATVRMVASTSFVRLSTVSGANVGRQRALISSILASTAAATVRLLAPISISAVPMTTSSPFSLPLPVRVRAPT